MRRARLIVASAAAVALATVALALMPTVAAARPTTTWTNYRSIYQVNAGSGVSVILNARYVGEGSLHTYYRLDDGPVTEYDYDNALWIPIYGDWKLEFWSVDVEGEETPHTVKNFRIVRPLVYPSVVGQPTLAKGALIRGRTYKASVPVALTVQRLSGSQYVRYKSFTTRATSSMTWAKRLMLPRGKYRLNAYADGSRSAWLKFTVK